ncbi:MAG: GntR family transcriptional regulator [Acidobacteria bacterium]|nr:GntR family transcriptional regulator [Acidobacteriota bacterium]MCI0720940.1 GntR family transcriptional regulator [Acidobacteriota bacterium]
MTKQTPRNPEKPLEGNESVKRFQFIYEELKKEIVLGKVKPGESLLEIELSKRFDISRAPIREACIHLHNEGFLNATPYKGYTVSEISMEEVKELYQVRLIIECSAAEMAAQNSHIRQDEIAEMECHLKTQQSKVEPTELMKHLHAETGFHMAIAKASGNALLAKFIGETLQRFQRFHLRVLRVRQNQQKATIEWHTTIMNSIKSENPRGARESMYQHIFEARENSLRVYFS